MDVAPWLVALLILVIATGAACAGALNIQKEPFEASLTRSRQAIVPPLKQPANNTWVMQAYGPYIRNVQNNDKFATRQGFVGDGPSKDYKMYPGMDQNIASSSVPLAYTASGEQGNPETESILRDTLNGAKQALGTESSIIPTQANLDRASGGNQEPANTPLTQGYQPHQERIAPHEVPRPQYAQVTANVHTDIGTDAEVIQRNSVKVPSLRERVRPEEAAESENFNNKYAINYHHF